MCQYLLSELQWGLTVTVGGLGQGALLELGRRDDLLYELLTTVMPGHTVMSVAHLFQFRLRLARVALDALVSECLLEVSDGMGHIWKVERIVGSSDFFLRRLDAPGATLTNRQFTP